MTIYFRPGNHYFLSNFYESPFIFNSKAYLTAEHAYQANKANSTAAHEWIRKAVTPEQAKKRGRQVVLKNNWQEIKIDVMFYVVTAKFNSSTILKNKLLNTMGQDLVEYTFWNDTFWGVDTKLNGRNELGKILMKIRSNLFALEAFKG